MEFGRHTVRKPQKNVKRALKTTAFPIVRVHTGDRADVADKLYANEPTSCFQIVLLVLLMFAFAAGVVFLALTLHYWSERDALAAAVAAATTPAPPTPPP